MVYSLDVILSQFWTIVPCLVLTVAFWPAYKFLRRQVKQSGIPMSLKFFHILLGFLGGSDYSKESACNKGDLGLIPRSGRFPEEGNGYLLQYSCLESFNTFSVLWNLLKIWTQCEILDEIPGIYKQLRAQEIGTAWRKEHCWETRPAYSCSLRFCMYFHNICMSLFFSCHIGT